MKKITIRALIICGWIGVLSACLYWPKAGFFTYDKNTINVFSWGDILDPKIIKAFEEETGINVNFNYYSSNEELVVKLKATKGEGYDLIIPSDYAVGILIKDQLLKKIDKSRLNFWNDIHPNLLGHFFDPCNHYSIPFEWELFLLGVNKAYFDHRKTPLGWGLIFDENLIRYKISMTNDPIEAISLASFYLFGPKSFLNESEIAQVKNLLISQKSWVEAYASFRGDYFLATGSCQVAVASSSYFWRTLKLFPEIGFVVPQEGTFLSIENLSIPKMSKKEDLTYKFINYLFREDSVRSHFETFGFFPSTLQSIKNLELDPEAKKLLLSSEEDFKKFYFMQEIIPRNQVNDIWVEIKSGKY
jgi:spermidine/putrescine transport system substrate-binding protein